jgi:RIO-like serine/threonine protein kinase
MKNLSGNSVSTVWYEDGFIFKKQPKYLTDNEWYALDLLRNSGFVPQAARLGIETIQMEPIVRQRITDPEMFRMQCMLFLAKLQEVGLRHGDLTPPHVFPYQNSPVVIDWGESRHVLDPRPDKRPEGDERWLDETIKALLEAQQES